MKKLKVFFINLIIFVLVLVVIEVLSYFCYFKKNEQLIENQNNTIFVRKYRYTPAHLYNIDYFDWRFNDYVVKNSHKRPVICVGDSYMEGVGIPKDKNLPAKISKLTGRSVYSRALSGGCPANILDEFQSGRYKELYPDAEYFVYVFIDYQLGRLYDYQMDFIETEISLRYKLDRNDNLVKVKSPRFPFLYSLFSVKLAQDKLSQIKSQFEYEDYRFFLRMMKEIMKEKKQQFPDAKFAIIFYPDASFAEDNKIEHPLMNPMVQKKLERMGYIVIDAEELTDLPIRTYNYRISDKEHPNVDAWDELAPKIVKAIGM